jgi:FAR-17a/AIG1-like protein
MAETTVAALSLHILGLISFTTSFHYLSTRPRTNLTRGFGGSFQFLTNIALLLSTLTFVSAVVHDVTNLTLFDRITRTIRCIATPLELIITVSYWTLYIWRRDAILDRRLTPLMPLWRDMGVHLFPALFLLGDHWAMPPQKAWRMNDLATLACFATFLAAYWMWVLECHRRNGIWPYPALNEMSGRGKVGATVGLTGAMWGARMLLLRWSSDY